MKAMQDGTIIVDFVTISFTSLPSTMEYAIKVDAEFISKQETEI